MSNIVQYNEWTIEAAAKELSQVTRGGNTQDI